MCEDHYLTITFEEELNPDLDPRRLNNEQWLLDRGIH